MASESITYYASVDDGRPFLASLLINENAFHSDPEFQEFLDIVTDFDCDGFYSVLRRTDSEYRQDMEASLLSAALCMTHTLKTLDEFDVFFVFRLHRLPEHSSPRCWRHGHCMRLIVGTRTVQFWPLRAIHVKMLSRTEPANAIITYTKILLTPMSLRTALIEWRTPDMDTLLCDSPPSAG